MTNLTDIDYMHMALELASRATMATSPNPKVGCVIVKNGDVLGQGWTQAIGEAHAEVMALNNAAYLANDVRGATAYVTLEPCSHFGRTPPCTNALIEAGIGRVVAAMEDPNPQVKGRGFQLLRTANIEVEFGLLANEARELNIGFFKRMEIGKPWVRLKVATSLDGYTALSNGQSQWITAQDARQDGHRWRARVDAVLTGIGTILADDPHLSVRNEEQKLLGFQPQKFVLDSQLRISPKAHILQGAKLTVVHAVRNERVEKTLQDAGVTLIHLPDQRGQVDLSALMAILGQQQINEVHVEAGAKLSGALISANHVDELLIYIAPKLLGGGKGMFTLPEIDNIDASRRLVFHEVKQIGETIRVLARFAQ